MKILAYFLPQFYATPENDKYWGKGFTDWDNVLSAKPLFSGHRQPITPSKFGIYDLSNLEAFEQLCDYSMENGIDGFGYWHYWFGNGHQTLEKVQEMHLFNKSIKQSFFFAWANQDWTKSWVGDDETIIFKQVYSELSAHEHFKYIKPFVEDLRYLKINKKPLFQVINPESAGCNNHILILEKEAIKAFGIGFHWIFPINRSIIGLENLTYSKVGYAPGDVTVKDFNFRIKRNLQKKGWITKPLIITEKKYLNSFRKSTREAFERENSYYPCILAGWDNTPRYKNKGFLIDANISSLLRKQFEVLSDIISNGVEPDFVFIKAWNEWAEGNVVEPYSFNGKYDSPMEVIKKIKKNG